MQISPALKIKLLSKIKREISIIRGMLFKEVMEWKRLEIQSRAKAMPEGSTFVTVDQIKLSDEEKKVIDSQIDWFLAEDLEKLGDDLVIQKAKSVLADLEKVKILSQPQKNLKAELQEALTVDNSQEVKKEPF